MSESDSFRQQMPVTHQWAYLDHAAVGPLTQPAGRAVAHWTQQAMEQGDTVWPEWARGVEQTRARLAAILGADSRQIALIPSTTAGLALVAEGFPWRAGDNVVVPENEFPSNLYPWWNLQDRGVGTRTVTVEQGRLEIDRILDCCDERTRLVSTSWVGYASGWRIDVARLATALHERGIFLVLDAIQGLGVFPLNVRTCNVDFLAADGHKWMLGPEGAGVFYVRDELLSMLRPTIVGWHSVVESQSFDRPELRLRPTAARFEGGTQNMVGFLALGASVELLAQQGLASEQSRIAERVLSIVDHARERIVEAGGQLLFDPPPEHRSGILTFSWPGHEPSEIRKACLQAGVALSCRGGGLRISLHAYNDRSDIDRLLAVLTSPMLLPHG